MGNCTPQFIKNMVGAQEKEPETSNQNKTRTSNSKNNHGGTSAAPAQPTNAAVKDGAGGKSDDPKKGNANPNANGGVLQKGTKGEEAGGNDKANSAPTPAQAGATSVAAPGDNKSAQAPKDAQNASGLSTVKEGYGLAAVNESRSERRKLSMDDFISFFKLGEGAFGRVLCVSKKGENNDKKYAMKMLRKEMIMQKKLQVHTILEQKVLRSSRHPFLVDLKYAFQTPTNVCFVMEYIECGNVYQLLHKVKRFDETCARFIFCEVMLGMRYMHEEMHIMYRDLKPENIMITKDGHIKIVDFGLARVFEKEDDKAKTIAGTTEYLAPELVFGRPYNKNIDIWTLGIFLYELLAGQPPFYDAMRNQNKIQEQIRRNQPQFPPYIETPAKDLIKQLLNSAPEQRLGAKSFDDIQKHYFFADVDWKKVQSKDIKSPLLKFLQDSKYQYNAQDQRDNLIRGRPIQETPAVDNRLNHIEGITFVPQIDEQNDTQP